MIASKCPGPYANRISEAFRIDFVHKSMLLRSTTKPPILGVLTNNHIYEAFRIDLVHKSFFYGQQQNPILLVFGGDLTNNHFFMRGVIVPPSKLIVTHNFAPKVFFIRGG